MWFSVAAFSQILLTYFNERTDDDETISPERTMKNMFVWMLCLAGLACPGCRHPDPPPPHGGVSINVPGVRVNVNDYGTSVDAPGTRVRVPQ